MDELEEMQKLLLKIPKGRVVSYKELARKLGIHPRTAARLLSRNPFPDRYPCYKVVCSDGRLGGYSGGLKEKKKRLEKDGIDIRNGGIDIKRFYHFS
ncbi:MAG: MGMT family protein [Candidatus Aenigmatarchaeota archaeon]